MSTPMNSGIHSLLNGFTVKQLLEEMHGLFPIPSTVRRNKSSLVSFIAERLPVQYIEHLQSKSQKRHPPVECPPQRPLKRSRLESAFMEPPDDDSIRHCFRQFLYGTSNHSLQQFICAVCGRQSCIVNGESIETSHVMPLSDIPNLSRLKPTLYVIHFFC